MIHFLPLKELLSSNLHKLVLLIDIGLHKIILYDIIFFIIIMHEGLIDYENKKYVFRKQDCFLI